MGRSSIASYVDDIAQAIDARLTTDTEGGGFQRQRRRTLAAAAGRDPMALGLLGMPPPPGNRFRQGGSFSDGAIILANNQRVSTASRKETLGVSLRYPTYREGLTALLNDV